ncbi:hypothetical protein Scep_017415 [Stephania cephalantha]|uniref:Uncharacterized protein n=1 Tax=Stephania cephalantha TaxID=152367 RepID=A0AAP0IPJ8_9MAGN
MRVVNTHERGRRGRTAALAWAAGEDGAPPSRRDGADVDVVEIIKVAGTDATLQPTGKQATADSSRQRGRGEDDKR